MRKRVGRIHRGCGSAERARATTNQIIALQGQTLASASVHSNVKDCIPGSATCSGFFSLDTATSVLQSTTVLPVILQPAYVQAFLPDVHIWSSPFHDGVDLGVVGALWDIYSVVAPQVAGYIGILQPDTGDMVWIDASGVGPTPADS